MTTFCTLASGSSGNAALLSCGSTHLLIDMGISCRRICRSLAEMDLTPADLSAVLITHEHADHISGLATYIKKYHTPILCTPGTARQLQYRLAGIGLLLQPLSMGQPVAWQGLEITPLPTSHDCRESAAYRVDTPDGSLGYLTDTGLVEAETRQGLLGADLLVLESNHDVDKLLSGPYPYVLKRRVMGREGHLSNADAAVFAADCARAGTRSIILAHLSAENNTPQLALDTVGQALEEASYTGELSVAPRSEPGKIHVMERAICRR